LPEAYANPFSQLPSIPFKYSSNGSVDHQDNVSSAPNPAQPRITYMLDGSRHNLDGQPDPISLTSYSDILKFRVGGNSSSKTSIVEPEFCLQFRTSKPPMIIFLGQTSITHAQPLSVDALSESETLPVNPSIIASPKQCDFNTAELITCLL